MNRLEIIDRFSGSRTTTKEFLAEAPGARVVTLRHGALSRSSGFNLGVWHGLFVDAQVYYVEPKRGIEVSQVDGKIRILYKLTPRLARAMSEIVFTTTVFIGNDDHDPPEITELSRPYAQHPFTDEKFGTTVGRIITGSGNPQSIIGIDNLPTTAEDFRSKAEDIGFERFTLTEAAAAKFAAYQPGDNPVALAYTSVVRRALEAADQPAAA